MVRITHTVIYGYMGCKIDCKEVAMESRDVIYSVRHFKVLRWSHKKIGGNCMIYESGKTICHGSRIQLRKYARLLQRMGFPIKLSHVRVVTMSAVHQLRGAIDYKKIVSEMGGIYEPGIYHACSFKRKNINFTVYTSGKVVITGIKTKADSENLVYPTIVELEML